MNASIGLGAEEIEERGKTYGPNVLPQSSKLITFFNVAKSEIMEPMILLLLVCFLGRCDTDDGHDDTVKREVLS